MYTSQTFPESILFLVNDSVLKWLATHAGNILLILVISYLIRAFSKLLLGRIIQRTVRHNSFPTETDRKKRVRTLTSITRTGINVLTAVIAGLMIINEIGIDTRPLLASAGFIGLTVGFGAQSLIRDFMAGVFITTENQYRVGDIIIIRTSVNEIEGTVEAITTRLTTLRDLNGYVHNIPNGGIVTSTNKTMDYGSINEVIYVPRETDLKLIEHVINHIGEQLAALPDFQNVITQPPQFTGITELQGDAIGLRIYGKTIAGDPTVLRAELLSRLNAAFIKNKIKLSPPK